MSAPTKVATDLANANARAAERALQIDRDATVQRLRARARRLDERIAVAEDKLAADRRQHGIERRRAAYRLLAGGVDIATIQWAMGVPKGDVVLEMAREHAEAHGLSWPPAERP